ncbi:MAG: ABC transporter substrate-binding protein [Solirubrobacterales bacterium]|nr:ABC transporter substrate-binding protein [Solirubrobacterales bacterium]
MKNERQRRTDEARKNSTELENNLVDELKAGRISRREFVRQGTVIGMSVPAVAFLASACGSSETTGGGGAAPQGQVRTGGTIRAGIVKPATALDPRLVQDQGGLAVLGQTGEYLAFSNNKLELEPRIAESWKPNADGSEWTFKIRQGVTFHDGSPVDARDVVASFENLTDPDTGGNALSAFKGVLSPGGAKARDASTVVFSLDNPTGNFPYIVSSDNYNAIIIPRDLDPEDWEKTFMGSAAWKLDNFRQASGVTFLPYANYWDAQGKPKAERAEIRFYNEEQAEVLALQGGEVDVIAQYSVSGGKALLTNPNVRTVEVRASQHRQVHMRTDKEPFQDKRVRQAVALLINRQAYVQGLLAGKADLGNDSPFAPVYPYSDRSVPQRQQDVAQAKELLVAAGKGDGFSVTLNTHRLQELPDLAALIQNDLKQAGINVRLNITDSVQYYEQYWLDSDFGITEYGHRGAPNGTLTAPLTSKGTWNAAHFENKEFDRAVADFTAALDPGRQRAAAGKIQRMLLDETPVLFPYFYFYLSGTKPNVGGVRVSPMGHVELEGAGFTA